MSEFFNKSFCLHVQGDYACFTRPEMKVERVSYDVITPSAARAIFEAIFWKPAIRWQIKKIEVLSPIQWTSVRRNEVGSVASERSSGIFVEDARQQRAGLFLRDVSYRLHAEQVFLPVSERAMPVRPVGEALIDKQELMEMNKDENPGKYAAMFERRAKKGQCFNQPYLGCREFSCSFSLVEDMEMEEKSINETRDLGFMLYDMEFSKSNDPRPTFFRAQMTDGVIIVPDWNSETVLR